MCIYAQLPFHSIVHATNNAAIFHSQNYSSCSHCPLFTVQANLIEYDYLKALRLRTTRSVTEIVWIFLMVQVARPDNLYFVC